VDTAPNAAQAQRWNGDSGRNWIAHRERHVAVRRGILPHLWRAAAIAPGDRVLDVGCGCGETTIEAARTAGTVLGLDLSAPMLDVARRLAADEGVTNVEFVQGDAQVHPLRPAFFDVVVSSFGVMFFADPAAAFGNLAAALRPGGRLAFVCWQDDRANEMFSIPLGAFQAHVRDLPGLLGEDDPFADPAWVTALLTGAGLTGVRVDPVREPAWLGSDAADVVGCTSGMRRIHLLLDELRDEALAARVLATMAGEYAARERPDGVWIDAAAWLVTATAPSSSAPESPAA
jgi:SAM-dependent methyltransferase